MLLLNFVWQLYYNTSFGVCKYVLHFFILARKTYKKGKTPHLHVVLFRGSRKWGIFYLYNINLFHSHSDLRSVAVIGGDRRDLVNDLHA